MAFRKDGKTLAVFSHPNYETAVFATLRDLRPKILYLTDGGSKASVEQTKRGLDILGVRELAEFLNEPRASIYTSILDRDTFRFRTIAGRIWATISTFKPDQILIDAVEYYNPIHDIALPLVQAALALWDGPEVPLFEVPLKHQDAKTGKMVIQRASQDRQHLEIRRELTEADVRMKVTAWSHIYTLLADILGPTVKDPGKTGAYEILLPAERPLAPRGCAMWYEARGQELCKEGTFKDVLTYEGHWVPVVRSLLGVQA